MKNLLSDYGTLALHFIRSVSIMLILADLSVELYNILYIESVSDLRVTVGKQDGSQWLRSEWISYACVDFTVGHFQTAELFFFCFFFDGLHCKDRAIFNIKQQFTVDRPFERNAFNCFYWLMDPSECSSSQKSGANKIRTRLAGLIGGVRPSWTLMYFAHWFFVSICGPSSNWATPS